MILSVTLYIDRLVNDTTTEYEFYMENITNTNIEYTDNTDTQITGLQLVCDNGTVEAVCEFDTAGIQASLQDAQLYALTKDDNGDTVIEDHIVEFTGDVDIENSSDLLYLIKNGIIGIKGFTYNQLLFTYRLNVKRNVVNKQPSLILVGIIGGTFRNGVNIKNPVISLENFNITGTFNYVYVYALNRYYYVDSVELTTKNITTLALSEDVLMSHKDLILSQNAFISRSADSTVYEMSLNDNRRVCGESNIYEYSEIDLSSIFSPEVTGQYTYEYKYIITVFRG